MTAMQIHKKVAQKVTQKVAQKVKMLSLDKP